MSFRAPFAALALAALVLPVPGGAGPAAAPPRFDDHFLDKTMRIDFVHVGDAKEESATIDRIFEQGIWAGRREALIDPFDLGRYRVSIADAATGAILFTKGFDSYFGEYRTSEEALKGDKRAYHESALVPYPRRKARFVLEGRSRDNSWRRIFDREIDPADPAILREKPVPGVRVFKLQEGGDPHVKVDLAFVAEGYTEAEEPKLRADLARFTGLLFSREPYRSRRDAFNVWGVWRPSAESGCDEPSHGVYKQTALGASFDALGSERYLLTEDNRSLRDIAAHVPYDILAVMVNHKRYGGGGIYNLYCTFTTDNQWHEYLFLHEFGHAFAGLADEYYTSDVAYNEFYPPGVEPVEPNITALLDPAALKWRDLATRGVPIPTPWEKAEFDRLDTAYQKVRRETNARIAGLKRARAPEAEIARAEEESERLSRENGAQVDAFLRAGRFYGQVGAFEGAGYASRGLFRPAPDCLMFTRGAKPFCPVCERAVLRTILHYAE